PPRSGGVTDWHLEPRFSAGHRVWIRWTPYAASSPTITRFIPGPNEDEREPMFIQLHDPDYVPEPMYPEYIPLEDEHVLPAEEKPMLGFGIVLLGKEEEFEVDGLL
nr:hypothetical protein [Tanacetum cinerariifolium]